MKTLEIIKKIGEINMWGYIASIIGLVLFLRVILCVFKAFAIKNGEADEVNGKKFSQNYSKFEAFYHSFLSNGRHNNIDDYFIPLAIGTIELFTYPFLMIGENWEIIGAWLVMKTASVWNKWKDSRTSYNRFLLGSLFVLVSSLFILARFLK